jgi:tRNA(His) 5'-end guanylyltransferase
MRKVATYLGDEFNSRAVYTESDEISLVWHLDDPKSEFYGGGKVMKLTSHLAAKATWKFTSLLPEFIPEKVGKETCFDARVWVVPSRAEACNVILWRQQDAYRNAVQMAARSVYSHADCYEKNSSDLHEMLFTKGINFNDYPKYFKGGSLFLRRNVVRKFSAEELEALPPKHEARRNPDLVFERSEWSDFTDAPILSKISNRVEFIFEGAEPVKQGVSL